MLRQLEPFDEITLARARASRIAQCDVGDISRKFRGWEFDLWGFLNVDRHFCARVERDRLASVTKCSMSRLLMS
jgi:hypothetical protein